MTTQLRPINEVADELDDGSERLYRIALNVLERERDTAYTLLREATKEIKADSKLLSSDPSQSDEYISRKAILTLLDHIYGKTDVLTK